ncbi:MAG: elongation factor G [Clostridia bacterium]|nr:elongation factor G [Clostridia bacterium]
MKGYNSETIRNIALVGHGGTGKTTFLEAALLATGVISRLGKVEDGNTVSDFDKMEIEKGYSIGLSVVPVEYNGCKINFLDTPGVFDFVGEVDSAMRAAGSAAIFVDASSGIQVGTEKAWASCNQFGIPRMFVINKTDKDNVNLDQVVEDLKAKFGISVVTLDDKDAVTEAIAETDEELMEKFFSGEEFTEEEYKAGLSKGIASGDIAPVITCSSVKGEGVKEVLDAIIKYIPRPAIHKPYAAKNEAGEDIEVQPSDNGAPSVFVFKTIADPFLGKISLAKVITGKLTPAMEIYNPRAEKSEKLGSMFFMRGKTQGECPSVSAGDIIAFAKLQFTQTGDTLCDKNSIVMFPAVEMPQPTLFTAIEPAKKGEDDKLTSGLRKLNEEDPSFSVIRNVETHQELLGTQGDIQAGIIMAKLKERYGAEVVTVPQKVAYRETIKGTSDVQGKHKKQTGGSGQYGDCHIRFSPSQEEFEFVDSTVGGCIPKQFIPAVEKGLRDCMEKGPLAGCKCQNIKADLYFGSYHAVDSDEMSFKVAASLAFKKGIVEAKPCLLEPVMHVEIIVPDDYTGDVMGDMNKRRGRILGMEPMAGGLQKLVAEAPQVELFSYANELRAMTQARGSFTQEFERYDEVPAMLATKIIEAHKAEEEE